MKKKKKKNIFTEIRICIKPKSDTPTKYAIYVQYILLIHNFLGYTPIFKISQGDLDLLGI